MNAPVETSQAGGREKISPSELPFVSVLMPVFNEEEFIARSLGTALSQEYPPNQLEIIVADGRSTDRTREIVQSIAAQHGNVRLIDNPGRIVSTGLNAAIACARGEIVVRLDGHCEYPKDYIRQVVRLRQQTQADNAGGTIVPTGDSYVQRCVGQAFWSPVGVGSPSFKSAPDVDLIREVDTVHSGCWDRGRLRELGGFDEEMVRNQDDELSFRLRQHGGRIFQRTSIQVKYHVRDSFKKLFLQFAQYGYWKVRVIRKHPLQASLRHFIPGLFVLLMMVAALLMPVSRPAVWLWCALAGSYLSTLSLVTLRQVLRLEVKLWPGTMLALMMMHLGYGGGFIVGVLSLGRGPLVRSKIFERVTR